MIKCSYGIAFRQNGLIYTKMTTSDQNSDRRPATVVWHRLRTSAVNEETPRDHRNFSCENCRRVRQILELNSHIASRDAHNSPLRYPLMETTPLQQNGGSREIQDEEAPVLLKENTKKLSVKIRPFLALYQSVGFYPQPFICLINSQLKRWQRWFATLLPSLLTLGLLVMFGRLSITLIQDFITAADKKGVLDPNTVMTIINSITALHNAVSIITLAITMRQHSEMMKKFDEVNQLFATRFRYRTKIRKKLVIVLLVFAVLFVVAETIYMLQTYSFEATPNDPGNKTGNGSAPAPPNFGPIMAFLIAGAAFFVPLFRVMQVIPLGYYVMYCYVLRQWYFKLTEAINGDPTFKHRSMKFYYSILCEIGSASQSFSLYFMYYTPFVLFLCVGAMCMTIYYVTQGPSVIWAYVSAPENYTTVAWALLQNITALSIIVIISYCGWSTNESARKVLAAALNAEPETEEDRFEILKCSHKFTTQLRWGISVWRAFPIERGFLFTVASIIVAYGLVLNKLGKKKVDGESANSTCTC